MSLTNLATSANTYTKGQTDALLAAKATATAFNAKDYGAVGDGTADDTAALQAAINAAGAVGGVAYIPQGTFRLTSTLTVPVVKGMIIAGAGWNTRLKLASNANVYAVTFTGHDSSGNTIRDLCIDGNCTNQPGTALSGCINAKGSVECRFDNIHFTAFKDDGLLLTAQDDSSFGHNNRVIGCLFDNSQSSAAAGIGIRMLSNDENQIIGCDFQFLGGSGSTGGDTAVCILDKAGTQFMTGCNFVNGSPNNTKGIRIQDCAASRIVDCNFDGTGGDSIFIAASRNLVVGNTVTGAGEGAAAISSGIHLEYNASQNLVVGNTVVSNSTNGKTRSLIREEVQGNAGNNLITNNVLSVLGTLSGSAVDVAAPGTVVRDNLGAGDVGSGTGAIVPFQNVVNAPTAGTSLYVQNGALKFRGGNGTVTTIGPA